MVTILMILSLRMLTITLQKKRYDQKIETTTVIFYAEPHSDVYCDNKYKLKIKQKCATI